MQVTEATSARTGGGEGGGGKGGGGGGRGGGEGGGGCVGGGRGGRRKEAGKQADIAAAKRVISMSVKLTRGYADVCSKFFVFFRYAKPSLKLSRSTAQTKPSHSSISVRVTRGRARGRMLQVFPFFLPLLLVISSV
jgi:hypothetical protein